VIIREATAADAPAITRIQNALLTTTTVEWTDRPHTVEARRAWLEDHQRRGDGVFVADDDGDVVGFAAYGDFRDTDRWPGYRFTVEHTIHVAESHWGSGAGRLLVEAEVEHAVAAGRHVLIAAITEENEGSIRFHERCGFTEVGRLAEVGTKLGRWLGVVFMQRTLTPGAPPPP
jgi:phosphinothricin acetyltransferase